MLEIEPLNSGNISLIDSVVSCVVVSKLYVYTCPFLKKSTFWGNIGCMQAASKKDGSPLKGIVGGYGIIVEAKRPSLGKMP